MTYTIRVDSCGPPTNNAYAAMRTPNESDPPCSEVLPPAPLPKLLTIPWLRSTPAKLPEVVPSVSTSFAKLSACECLGCGRRGTLKFRDAKMQRVATSPEEADNRIWERSRLEIFPQSSSVKRSRSPVTESLDTDRTERERKRWKQLLRGVFDNLAGPGDSRRSAPFRAWRERKMDKETFLQVFPELPGVVGERLFAAFDLNRNGSIDFEEFVSGLSVLSSANLGQKLQLIFHMYDLNGDGELSRDELAMMLYHIPASINFLSQTQTGYQSHSSARSPNDVCRPSSSSITDMRLRRRLKTVQTSALLSKLDSEDPRSSGDWTSMEARRCSSSDNLSRRRLGEGTLSPAAVNEKMMQMLRRIRPDQMQDPMRTSVEEFEAIIDGLVDHAFQISDHDKLNPQMDYQTFCQAVVKFPDLRAALEIFCSDTIPPQAFMPIPPDVLMRELAHSRLRTAGQSLSAPATPDQEETLSMDCDACGMKYEVFLSTRDSSSVTNRTPRWQGQKRGAQVKPDLAKLPCFRGHGGQVDIYGWLEKDGRMTGWTKRRFFILRDRFLYYYHDTNEVTPAQAFVLTGCHVERTFDDREQPSVSPQQDDVACPKRFQARYGFELHFPQGRKARLYCRASKERDDWVTAIAAASGSASSHFHEIYLLKETLGVGRFATVFAASRRATGEKVAVKVLRRPSRRLGDTNTNESKRHERSHRWRKILGRRKAEEIEENESESFDESDANLQLFQRTEVAVLRLLNHPNLIRLLDVFSTPEFLYIVMEWNPASDVQRMLNMVSEINTMSRERVEAHELDQAFREMWVPEWIVRETVIGILRGLTFLHSSKRNVIHRDLKPDNVLLKVNTMQIRYCFQQAFPSLPRLTPEGLLVNFRVRSERSNTTPSAAPNFQQRVSPVRFVDSGDLSREFEDEKQHGMAMGSSSGDLSAASAADEQRQVSESAGSSIDTLDLYTVKHGPEDSTTMWAELQEQLQESGRRETLCSNTSGSPYQGRSHLRFADGDEEPIADSISSKYELLLARETLNFWLFINCLDFIRKPDVPQPESRESAGLRSERRRSTMPATTNLRNEAASRRMPAFLASQSTSEILSQTLDRLAHSQLTQKVCQVFAETSLMRGAVVPQITDFGLSKIIAPPEQNLRKDLPLTPVDMTGYAKEALGTVAYAAPEVLQGLRYTTSADLWSLGVMTYQLLSGGSFPIFADLEGCGQQAPGVSEQRSCSLAEVSGTYNLNKAKLLLLYVPESAWVRVSQGAKAFVAKMLSVEPQNRISAKAALEDPWITQQWPPQDRWFC